MHQVKESSRVSSVLAEADVLVVGSGPGGLAAAIGAAREGVDTVLVERYGCFGGNITQATVESIAWYRHEGTVESDSIGLEFERRALEMGAGFPEPQSQSLALNTELFKFVADQLVLESGVQPILHCLGVAPIMEGDAIRGIMTESKSGRRAILAKRIIDATGDADIAFRAGAPCHMAPKEDSLGVTVNFSCRGVDKDRFLEYVKAHPSTLKNWAAETTGKEENLFSPYIEEPFIKAKQAGEIPENVDIAGTWSSISDEGEATNVNVVYILNTDPTDVRDLTRAEISGRQQAMWAIDALKRYTPGFENAKLGAFASSLGTRESRKIIGQGLLTEDDVRNQGRFEDSIGIFPEFIDGYGVVIIPTTGRYFQVPYGILVPRIVENLLVAGRCVAGDQGSHAATRAMMCCALTGQGAGVAAAVSIKEGQPVRSIDIGKVQGALRRQGVRIA